MQSRLPSFLLLISLCLAPAVGAQDTSSFRASAMLGIAGALDAEPDSGVDNSSFQLGFSWLSEPDILVGLRYGEIDFDDEDGLGARRGSDLSYVTVAGEYPFDEGSYTSGVYLGLGYYRVEESAQAGLSDDTSLGVVLGLTGDFPVTEVFSLRLELSGHYTDLDAAQFFAMGHAGVAFRF